MDRDRDENPALWDDVPSSTDVTDGPAGDPCSVDAVEKRFAREQELAKKMVENKCLPDSFSEDPCKSLKAEWDTIKDTNGRCNAKAGGITECDYYKALVDKKYGPVVASCDDGTLQPNKPPKEAYTGFGDDKEGYCNYARMSLKFFTSQRDYYCDDVFISTTATLDPP